MSEATRAIASIAERAVSEDPTFWGTVPCAYCGKRCRWPVGLVAGGPLDDIEGLCDTCEAAINRGKTLKPRRRIELPKPDPAVVDRFKREEEQREALDRRRLFAASGAPDIPITAAQWRQFPALQALVDGERHGCFLVGPIGIGKTRACAELVRRWSATGRKSIYISEGDMLSTMRDDANRRTLLLDMQRVPLLIIDDCGARKATPWRIETYFDVLDQRYANRRPTLLVSNKTPSESDMFATEARLMRRLLEIGHDEVTTVGSDE